MLRTFSPVLTVDKSRYKLFHCLTCGSLVRDTPVDRLKHPCTNATKSDDPVRFKHEGYEECPEKLAANASQTAKNQEIYPTPQPEPESEFEPVRCESMMSIKAGPKSHSGAGLRQTTDRTKHWSGKYYVDPCDDPDEEEKHEPNFSRPSNAFFHPDESNSYDEKPGKTTPVCFVDDQNGGPDIESSPVLPF